LLRLWHWRIRLLPLRSRTIRQISRVETSPDDVRQQTERQRQLRGRIQRFHHTVMRVHVHPFHSFSLSTSEILFRLTRTTINCLMHANTLIFLAYFRVTVLIYFPSGQLAVVPPWSTGPGVNNTSRIEPSLSSTRLMISSSIFKGGGVAEIDLQPPLVYAELLRAEFNRRDA
jgi:hypothetical protein